MKHDRLRLLLHAYHDGQLGPWRRFWLGRHIGTCPACLAELETLQGIKSTLRANLTMHRAPPALAMRIGSALVREARPAVRRRPVRLKLAGSAMAGGLAGVALTLAVTGIAVAPDKLATDVVADHVRSLMEGHLTDVATSDQHTVKPWLSARLDLSPVVKDFAADGFPLVGGRLDYVDGHRAAAIVYRRDRHVINLFVFVLDARSDQPPRQQTRDGFNIVRWRMGGLCYVAVSDVEVGQLLEFARLIQG